MHRFGSLAAAAGPSGAWREPRAAADDDDWVPGGVGSPPPPGPLVEDPSRLSEGSQCCLTPKPVRHSGATGIPPAAAAEPQPPLDDLLFATPAAFAPPRGADVQRRGGCPTLPAGGAAPPARPELPPDSRVQRAPGRGAQALSGRAAGGAARLSDDFWWRGGQSGDVEAAAAAAAAKEASRPDADRPRTAAGGGGWPRRPEDAVPPQRAAPEDRRPLTADYGELRLQGDEPSAARNDARPPAACDGDENQPPQQRLLRGHWIALTGFKAGRWPTVKAALEPATGPVEAWVLTDGITHAVRFRTAAHAQKSLLLSGCAVAGSPLFAALPKEVCFAPRDAAVLCKHGVPPRGRGDPGGGVVDFSAPCQQAKYPAAVEWRGSGSRDRAVFAGAGGGGSLWMLKSLLSADWLSPLWRCV